MSSLKPNPPFPFRLSLYIRDSVTIYYDSLKRNYIYKVVFGLAGCRAGWRAAGWWDGERMFPSF